MALSSAIAHPLQATLRFQLSSYQSDAYMMIPISGVIDAAGIRGGGGISTTYVPKCFPQAIQDDHEESKFTRTSGSVITSTSAEKVAMSEVNKLVGSAEGFQLDAKERPGRR